MRTKKGARAFKDYRSSDYGNEEEEDYGQDYDEPEEDPEDDDNNAEEYDQQNPDSVESDYQSGEEGAKRPKARRRNEVHDQAVEDTYEDEDPFTPEIDTILADKQVEVQPATIQGSTVPLGRPRQASLPIQQQPKIQNWFLVKYADQSYLHVRWVCENDLEESNFKAKQKIRRYWGQKEKKRFIQEQMQRQVVQFKKPSVPKMKALTKGALSTGGGMHHHFSDDDEEEEQYEALADAEALNILPEISPDANEAPVILEPERPKFLSVFGPYGDDLTQYFDKNYVAVERILSTTQIFPVIHPRQAKGVRGKWQDDCLKVVNVLINYRKNNISIGLTFAEQIDADNENFADYFKVVSQPIDFIMIMNRLYNRNYEHPSQFWNDLGLVFKNCRSYYKSQKFSIRKQCDLLRCLAYHLYNDWHKELNTRFVTGIALPPPPPQPIKDAFSNQIPTNAEVKASTVINLQSLFKSQKLNQDKTSEPIAIAPKPPAVVAETLPQQQVNMHSMQWGQQQALPVQESQFQLPQSLPKFNSVLGGTAPQISGMGINMMDPTQQQMMSRMGPQIQGYDQASMQQKEWMQVQGGLQSGHSSNNMFSGQNVLVGQGIDMNTGRQIQLPSMNQLGQNIMQPMALQQQLLNQNGLQSALMGQNQFGVNPFVNQMQAPNQQIDFNQLQAIQQMGGLSNQDKSNLIYQLMGGAKQGGLPQPGMQQYQPSLETLMTQGQLDYNTMNQLRGGFNTQQQLPSLSSIQGLGLNQYFGNNQVAPSFQLPSLSSQLGPNFTHGSNMSTFDPYSSMNVSHAGFQQNQIQQLQQQQRFMLPGINSAMAQGANLDELQQYINLQSSQGPGGFNPFSQQPTFNMPQNNQMYREYNRGRQAPYIPKPVVKTQTTSIIDPNLIQQAELNENYVEKSEPPVLPCIMDPGPYDLSWLLENGETPEQVSSSFYITKEEIEEQVRNKHNVDQLYLVKWKGLSYTQSTWEPESHFKCLFDERILDYNRYNRSLDQFQRDRLEALSKNHKKMLRFTEKKVQSHGNRKIDPIQENFIALQEAKMNRSLLNTKIQEIMGDQYYNVVQYNEERGIVPKFKKANQKLKDYQVIGLNWLIRAWHEHRNVVLADEMGLGKTIMTLSLFDHLNKVNKLRGPYLILAPLTTLEHWKRIADEWTHLNSVLYYDPNSSEGRAEIRQWEWFYTDVTHKGTITQKAQFHKFNIMITSFEVFMSDINPILQEIPFIYIVVDEAHRLKNKQAKTLRLLKDHPCKRILLLTGTPVQNNTKELWTLLNYIEPEKFSNMEYFLEHYGNLESYEQIQKLHTILKPHFLRRLKEEVENSIPPLNETVVEVGLTSLQNTYYKGIYGENRLVLAKFGSNSVKSSQLNNMDVQLRKCCNHLFLLKGVEEELTRDCKTDEDLYNKLLESSGKLMLLDKFIEKFKKENHKILIFSQFKRMLDIIELYLKMKSVPYEKLTGSVKTQDRISAITRFNDDKLPSGEGGGSGFGVFLLTTRAGGLGINLTSARVVIIFDSDWNPQNDLQAIARAHRIGQKFEVQVYRLITSKTYEEQMFERASKKLGMEQALFSKGAFNNNGADLEGGFQLRSLTELKQDSKDIENLLKYGAYAFMDNDAGDVDAPQNMKNKDIDEILATGKKKEFSYNKGVYTLQKSTFNASKYEKSMPDMNDPEFWNKVLPHQSIISISMLERKFKKEKKEIARNEKEQKEFIKDLEIVFNDFIDAKFDMSMAPAAKKQLEADEELLREMLKKMVKLSGMKLMYVEKCKEWLREMLRTSKRKKPLMTIDQVDNAANPNIEDDDEMEVNIVDEDDIIIYDSENEQGPRTRPKRAPTNNTASADIDSQEPKQPKKERKTKTLFSLSQTKKDEVDFLEDDEDEEEAKDEPNQAGQRRSKRKRFLKNDDDELYGDDADYSKGPLAKRKRPKEEEVVELSGEERYGLRGRLKRQRTDLDDYSVRYAQHASIDAAQKSPFSIAKRNEKNGIVCSYCLHPETPDSSCTWFCQSYCQRSFHSECKDNLFCPKPEADEKRQAMTRSNWSCDDCLDNVAECYCCKKKGIILVFPKKGKPKAAGSNTQMDVSPTGGNVPFDEQLLLQQITPIEVPEEDLIKIQEENVEAVEESPVVAVVENNEQQVAEEAEPLRERCVSLLQEMQSNVSKEDSEEKKEQVEELTKLQLDIPDENEEPIIDPKPFSNYGSKSLPKDSLPESPSNQYDQSQQQNSADHTDEPDPNDPKYVVRCTLGGCFKYYHVNCVYQNKNVSCINSMKVQRFRCPLHYCEICQASGDSVLIVQCVDCPTAYHVKCMPKGDPNAIRLTKKFVICRKHKYNSEDFPKFEEKTNSYILPQQANEPPVPEVKPLPKKRGRKPKSYYQAQAEAKLQQERANAAIIQESKPVFEEEKQPITQQKEEDEDCMMMGIGMYDDDQVDYFAPQPKMTPRKEGGFLIQIGQPQFQDQQRLFSVEKQGNETNSKQ